MGGNRRWLYRSLLLLAPLLLSFTCWAPYISDSYINARVGAWEIVGEDATWRKRLQDSVAQSLPSMFQTAGDHDGAAMHTSARTLVTAPIQPGGGNNLDISAPFQGRLKHLVTSIHPTRTPNKTSYQSTSLMFLEGPDADWKPREVQDSLSSYLSNLTFACSFVNETRQAQVIVSVPHYFTVECDLHQWTPNLTLDSPTEARNRELQIFFEHPYNIMVSTNKAYGSRSLGSIQASGWTESKRQSRMSGCLSPAFDIDSAQRAEMLEWRVHHLLQGVEVVHWYSRDEDMLEWVHWLNRELKLEDTFQRAPYLNARAREEKRWYADQSIWNQECYMRYSFNDDWIMLVDTDEYLIQAGQGGAGGVARHLGSLPADIATVQAYQSYFSQRRPQAEYPAVAGFPSFPRNAFQRYTSRYMKFGTVRQYKSIHRTSAVEHIWVHSSTRIHPSYRILKPEPSAQAGDILALHSREHPFEDLKYDEDYSPSSGDRAMWVQEAKLLRHLAESMPL